MATEAKKTTTKKSTPKKVTKKTAAKKAPTAKPAAKKTAPKKVTAPKQTKVVQEENNYKNYEIKSSFLDAFNDIKNEEITLLIENDLTDYYFIK